MEPDTVPLISGQPVRLVCVFDAEPPANITWYKKGKPFVKRPNGEKWKVEPDFLYLENTTPSDEGDYMCVARNSVGEAEHTYHLLVESNHAYPPVIDTGILHSQHVSIGDKISLECRFYSQHAALFSWQRYDNVTKDWIIVQNQTSFSNGTIARFLNISSFSPADVGKYKCWTQNKYGPRSHEILLELRPEPVAARMMPRDLTFDIAMGAAGIVALVIIAFASWRVQELKKSQITVVHAEQSFIIRRVVLEHDSGGKCLSPRVKIETETVNLSQLGAADKKRALNEYQLPLDKDWEVARDKLLIGEKLGEGAFGVVFKATARSLSDGKDDTVIDVAIKMLKDSHTDSDLRDLVSEMEVMKKVGRHKNIISLLGCVTQDGLFLLFH